ncbi:MAG: cupin domain-containing protein [Chloroflexota bacterium]|nr:cupin domain-containing protein [Chloroflexota bacterium]
MGVIHKLQSEADAPSWRWDGVEVYRYNSNDATKQVVIGREDGAHNFEVRYFTIPPHGFSSLDEHPHDHGVMIMQGRARVMMGDHFEDVGVGDIVYIPGMEQHQFENLTDDVFAFLCIIPPKPVTG